MSEQLQPAAAQNGDPPQLSDDEVLDFTRKVRVKVVTSLMQTGQVSGENSDRILLTNMLKDLDTQALNKKKIAVDAKNNDNSAAIVAELLRSVNKQTAFQVTTAEGDVTDVTARVVPTDIGDMPALPGELDVSPPQMDYNSFVRSQGRDADTIGRDVKHNEAVDDAATDF